MQIARTTFGHLSVVFQGSLHRFKLTLLVALSATGLVACGAPNSNPVDPAPSEKAIVGDLVTNYAELIASTKAGKCDKANTDLRLQIVKSLDDHTAAIKQASHDRYAKIDPAWTVSKIGPETIITLAPKPTAPDGWTTYNESWTAIESQYSKLNASSPIEKWMALNSSVRSVLMNDRNRILHNTAYAYHHDDFEALNSARDALQACKLDASCVSPTLTPAAKILTDRISYYSFYLREALDPAVSSAVKRVSLNKMLDWMKFDLDNKYTGWKSTAVSRTAPHEFTVQLNSGIFKGFESVIGSLLEKTWQIGEDKIRISWQDDIVGLSAYTYLIDQALGSRAYVLSKERLVHLTPITRSGTLVHEFGHVMGLPDQYYEMWDPSTCMYTTETNNANLMSESSRGAVRQEHFELLKALY